RASMTAVGDVFVVPFRGRPGFGLDGDPTPPASLRETALASADSLRLAWAADPGRIALVAAVNVVTASTEVAQLLSGKRALEAVLAGDRSRAQIARLL